MQYPVEATIVCRSTWLIGLSVAVNVDCTGVDGFARIAPALSSAAPNSRPATRKSLRGRLGRDGRMILCIKSRLPPTTIPVRTYLPR